MVTQEHWSSMTWMHDDWGGMRGMHGHGMGMGSGSPGSMMGS
jgi:hypothetical protein